MLYTKVVTSFTVDLKRHTFILFKIEGLQLLYLKYLYTVILHWIMFRHYDLVFLRGKVLPLKKEGKILSTGNLRKSGEGERREGRKSYYFPFFVLLDVIIKQ